ncbi:MAG: sugar-transfer associated ATP-grasp domain-containing protein [Gemmataceae bacterium]
MYSLAEQPDVVLVQERVRLHPAFASIAFQGIPDVRVIVYRGKPAMAMLRLPTRASGGRANLHQGGLGVGIELATGLTHRAVQSGKRITRHPDTDVPLVDFRVPYWPRVLDIARDVARAVGLGYVGVDIVIDARRGPMLLEANARPGLAIQMANGRGLLPALEAIDRGARDDEDKIVALRTRAVPTPARGAQPYRRDPVSPRP